MAAKSIISRPVYGTLSPQPGRHHLFVADAEGALAILDLAAKPRRPASSPAPISSSSPAVTAPHVAALEALKPAQFYQGHSFASALPRLKQTLANAHMGLRVYLAGTEGLIGQAMQVALEAGIDHTSIQTEHRGSLARRMQCVHCKGITENVTTQPATCSHCGLLLLVRDHYSRRLAAFQGVCINAEDRTEIPATEEIFR